MQKVLIVIDMQNDFVTGCLGSSQAVAIVPNVVSLVKNFNGTVLFTRDTHSDDYLETQEGKFLPVKHCIKGTEGHEIIRELEDLRKTEPVDKYSFGSLDLIERLKELNNKDEIESITLAGVCTDICVVSNALIIKAAFPELPLYVKQSCCAGVTVEKHNAAIETLKSCQCIVC